MPKKRKKKSAAADGNAEEPELNRQHVLLTSLIEVLRKNYGNDYEKVAKVLLAEVEKVSVATTKGFGSSAPSSK